MAETATSGRELDVLIVGAGFAGLYMLHRLRGLGLSAHVCEAASGVGGTWWWNRYPGARCDVESMQYSYSFSEELQQEWHWPETFSAQPDILRYAEHVAEKFDLTRDISFNTRITAAHFDAAAQRWTVQTNQGETISAAHLVMATGCLSSTKLPEIPGIASFAGRTFHTGEWPHKKIEFAGRTVGIIGTGSSAIQSIPVIAAAAKHVYVFQRTPNFSIPSRNRPMTPDYESSWKQDYAAKRDIARHSRNGIVSNLNDVSAIAVPAAERRRIYEERWKSGGTTFMAAFNDLALNKASNDTARDFVHSKIRETVKNPEIAAKLLPTNHPIGTKRICVDTNYYETYNRPNVTLIDVLEDPVSDITRHGLIAGGNEFAFDDLVFATGFDAMTGTLLRIDISGRNGQTLAAKWADGPRTCLGLMTAGFPNLFMITGPGSPSVLSNMMVSIEQHVDWIADCLATLRRQNIGSIEPTQDAENDWVAHVNEVAHRTLYPLANSWYMGANVPGKPRIFMPYIGGVGTYRDTCDTIAANNYPGFTLTPTHIRAAAE